MRVYHVKANTPNGNIDLKISRSEIINMKKQIVTDDDELDYIVMREIVSEPDAIIRYVMIPGTRELRYLLSICNILKWFLIIAVIFFVFINLWGVVICLFIFYLNKLFRRDLCYEIVARLYVLDQKLAELENDQAQ